MISGSLPLRIVSKLPRNLPPTWSYWNRAHMTRNSHTIAQCVFPKGSPRERSENVLKWSLMLYVISWRSIGSHLRTNRTWSWNLVVMLKRLRERGFLAKQSRWVILYPTACSMFSKRNFSYGQGSQTSRDQPNMSILWMQPLANGLWDPKDASKSWKFVATTAGRSVMNAWSWCVETPLLEHASALERSILQQCC